MGQGTGDRVGFRVTLGTGWGLGDTSLGFWGGTREWGEGGVQGLDTEDRVGVRVGTEETPLGYWGGTGDRGQGGV